MFASIINYQSPLFTLLAASQEDVFKSISDNVGQRGDSGKALLLLLAAGLLVVVLVVIGQRRKREAVPKALNHAGQLNKEIVKGVELKGQQMKRLKEMAAALREKDGTEIHNPLVLLLCPSLLAKAMEAERG
jgi:hypothetical protein